MMALREEAVHIESDKLRPAVRAALQLTTTSLQIDNVLASI